MATVDDQIPDSDSRNPPAADSKQRWPGWPGASVFRLAIPVNKVGFVIGRKGETVKRLAEETRARIRVLEAPFGSSVQIVLISAKEDVDAEIPPAMDAAIRVFKRVNEIAEDDDSKSLTGSDICSVRLLVSSVQAIHVIGKQGATVKSIQESSGATIRILSRGELPLHASEDERIVEIQGTPAKVLTALKNVLGLLRKFLVDHGVLPLFEKNVSSQMPDAKQQTASIVDQDLLVDRHMPAGPVNPTRVSIYGSDPSLSGLHASSLRRNTDAVITQVTQQMHIPLKYADDLIGVDGSNISYIRRTSGAAISVKESRIFPEEIEIEIGGTPGQVQTAHELIQDSISRAKEISRSSYGTSDSSMRPPYSSYLSRPGSSYLSSSYREEHPYSNYDSSLYSSYRRYGF